MVEQVQVLSRSPFEIYHILNGLEKTAETTVDTELSYHKVKARLAALLPYMEVWAGQSTIKIISMAGLKQD